MGEKTITMSRKEVKRLAVIQRLLHQQITTREAAMLLGLSVRQVYRIKARVLQEGEEGIVHKNRGRKPAHALSEDLRHTIVELYQSKRYKGSNDHPFAELLAEYEGIRVSPSTVRRVLRSAGIRPARKRRPPKAHRPRPRKPQAGLLVHLDASPHAWFEDRGEPCVLLKAVDDATGAILAARFQPTEDLTGYFRLLTDVIQKHGLPVAVYTDRHRIFESPNETLTVEQELAGLSPQKTQFGLALEELGIEHIKALSPQAKGRIERCFQTTQDRWIIELRLRKVGSVDEGNEVLPELIEKHNRLFAVEPAEKESAFVPYTHPRALKHILCYRGVYRKVGSGQTISYQGHTYKIVSDRILPLKTEVEVRQTLDGSVCIEHSGEILFVKRVEKPVRKPASKPEKEKAGVTKPRKPAPNHPWRKAWVTPKSNSMIPQNQGHGQSSSG